MCSQPAVTQFFPLGPSCTRTCRFHPAAAAFSGDAPTSVVGVSLAPRHQVECRIRVIQTSDGCTVHLAGRLGEAQACELRRVCAEAAGRLRLDLTELVSLDAVGVDVLRRLRDDGAAIVGVAEYLKQKLGPSH